MIRYVAHGYGRRLLTGETGFSSKAVHVWSVVDRMALGPTLLPSTSPSFVNCHSAYASYSHSFAIDATEANLVLTASLYKQQKGIIMLGLDN